MKRSWLLQYSGGPPPGSGSGPGPGPGPARPGPDHLAGGRVSARPPAPPAARMAGAGRLGWRVRAVEPGLTGPGPGPAATGPLSPGRWALSASPPPHSPDGPRLTSQGSSVSALNVTLAYTLS